MFLKAESNRTVVVVAVVSIHRIRKKLVLDIKKRKYIQILESIIPSAQRKKRSNLLKLVILIGLRISLIKEALFKISQRKKREMKKKVRLITIFHIAMQILKQRSLKKLRILDYLPLQSRRQNQHQEFQISKLQHSKKRIQL